MKTQTIEVEGLPDGYKVIEAHVTSSIKGTNSNGVSQLFASITVEKIQPRRMALEETEELVVTGKNAPVIDTHTTKNYRKIQKRKNCRARLNDDNSN